MTSILDLFSLQGKTALITGATRGLGRAMSLALASAGATTLLLQRTDDPTTRDLIAALPDAPPCHVHLADLASPAAVAALLPALRAAHGADLRIDILVNCAGIQRRHPAESFPDDDWAAVLQVNLTSVFGLCRDIGGYMLTQAPDARGRRGTIINVASLLSFQGGITVAAYAASKGAVAQLTKALSNEWAGRGVTVNAIAPGYIATEMNDDVRRDAARERAIAERIPAGRWGTAEDLQGVVVWLASAAAGYVSGEIVTVDGGWMGR